MAASGPKEPDNGLSLNVAPAPSPVAVGKGNVESSTSSSDDDSSESDSEESDSGSESSSTTSSSGSHTEKPVKPSSPTEVGTVVVSTAELVAAASAASVAVAKVLGPDLPSASLFEAPPEEAFPETMVLVMTKAASFRRFRSASKNFGPVKTFFVGLISKSC